MLPLATPYSASFTHGEPYISNPANRPYIEVEIAAVTSSFTYKGSFKTLVLVDSGADMTMLDASVAGKLGIDLSRCPTKNFYGIGDKPVAAYISEVLVYLCEKWFRIPVSFVTQNQTPLLGRNGTFDLMLLSFDSKNSALMALLH